MGGFSEGVTLVTVNHTTEGLERATNRALEIAGTWIDDQGLKLAHAKTETMVLTGKWAYRQPLLFSPDVQVLVMCMVKYLGVTLDSKLTFIRHIRVVSASAKASACVVGRLIPNIGGPSARKRKLFASLFQAGSFTWHRRGHPGQLDLESTEPRLGRPRDWRHSESRGATGQSLQRQLCS